MIDVGVNRIADSSRKSTRLVGDVAYEEALTKAGAITPVPGGVGLDDNRLADGKHPESR